MISPPQHASRHPQPRPPQPSQDPDPPGSPHPQHREPHQGTNITDQHREAFDALIAGENGDFRLVSGFVYGQPAAATATLSLGPPTDEHPDGEYGFTPFFVTPT